MTRPVARVQFEDRYKLNALGQRVITGPETVRTAQCGIAGHPVTSNFVGVSEHGWIFRCRGSMRDGSQSHAFVASPPGGKGNA